MKFVKKAMGATAPAADAADETPKKSATTLASLPAKQASASGATAHWAKKGASAHEEMEKAEQKAELRKAEQGKLWRFWMEPETERRITFLDGMPDADGLLDCPMFYEHSIMFNGNRATFVCTAEAEGHCVICDSGKEGSQAALVGMLTICDHTPHKIKKGPNAGKTIANQRKLFVAKRETIKQLSKIAVKREGLIGATFDVSRGNDRTAAVGNQFDFIEKLSIQEIIAKYDIDKPEEFLPAVLDEEITYRTNAELIELGVGKSPSGPGYEKKAATTKKVTSDEL